MILIALEALRRELEREGQEAAARAVKRTIERLSQEPLMRG
jgi:hypothetical protein